MNYSINDPISQCLNPRLTSLIFISLASLLLLPLALLPVILLLRGFRFFGGRGWVHIGFFDGEVDGDGWHSELVDPLIKINLLNLLLPIRQLLRKLLELIKKFGS